MVQKHFLEPYLRAKMYLNHCHTGMIFASNTKIFLYVCSLNVENIAPMAKFKFLSESNIPSKVLFD